MYNTMISPEEKKLDPRCLCLRKILIGFAGVITTFAIMVTVSLYGDLSKSHRLFFSMLFFSFLHKC